MKAGVLGLMAGLVLLGCNEARVSSDESLNAIPALTAQPLAGPLYLTERVAIVTEESLYGLKAGTELKLIEERPTGLLVVAEGMQFEIEPHQTTHHREVGTLLARAKEREASGQITTVERWQAEDRKFLAEENLRQSAAEEAHLRNAVDHPRR
jgi:hypothetical protein